MVTTWQWPVVGLVVGYCAYQRARGAGLSEESALRVADRLRSQPVVDSVADFLAQIDALIAEESH